MERRTFLVRTAIGGVVLPLVVSRLGCTSDDETPTEPGTGTGSGTGTGTGSGSGTGTGSGSGTGTGSGSGTGTGGAVDCPTGTDFRSTSQFDNTGHTHDILIACDDVILAPASRSYVTLESGHTHQVTLTGGDFGALSGGGSVTVESSVGGGHTHIWIIRIG